MSGKNKVELDVRLNLDEMDKDFDKAGKEAKTGAQVISKALDGIQDSIDETADKSKKSTDEMKSASEKLIAAIRSQESELADLKKAYLNTALEQGKNSDEARKLKKQIEQLSSELYENKKKLQDAEYSADDFGDSIQELGDDLDEANEKVSVFGDVLKGSLASEAIEKGVEILLSGLQSVVSETLDLQEANQKLAASTGATAEEMVHYSDVMEELYKDNYGDSIEEIADNMALVKQYTGEIDPTNLQELTENAMALDDTFENMDLGETIRGVDALMTNMGLSAQEAFDYIAKGAQNGLNKSGELTDNIAEYSQLWVQAGFSAEEMFTILDNGLDSGAYNLDKVNDFVKEFSISLSDGRIEDNIDSFSDGTKELFKQWKNGEATTRDVFYSIIKDLSNMTNQQEALTLASNTWSALGEDNAMAVITALDDVNDAYSDVYGTMEDIKSVRYDTLESRIQSLGREITTDFVQPIIEKALPKMEKGLDAVIDNMDTLIPVTEVAIAALVSYKAVTTAASAAQGILNAAMSANPATMVALGVAAAGAAWVIYTENTQEASEETQILLEESQKLNEEIEALSEEVETAATEWQESTASLEAQKSAADKLVDELYVLESQTNKGEGEMQRMNIIVGELNEMFPELALAIDEQTGKLTENRQEVEKSIEASLKYQRAKVAEEKLAEISEQLVEVELKKYEAEKKNGELEEQLIEIQEKRNKLGAESITVMDEYGRCFNVASDQEKGLIEEETNLRAEMAENQESIDALKEDYETLTETYAVVEEYMDGQIDKSAEVSAAYEGVADTVSETAQSNITVAGEELAAFSSLSEGQQQLAVDLTNSVLTMQDNVQSALESQMNMFEEFDKGTKISSETLLENMQTQIDGVKEWEQNLSSLADRGINQNLLQYLANMGPEGAAYVQAFVDMSADQLTMANDKWGQSLEIKSMTDEWGQELLTSGAENIASGMDGIETVMEESGTDTVMGLVNGVKAAQADAEAAGEDLGVKLIESIDSALGVSSPSKKTKQSGKYAGQGLTLGINGEKTSVQSAGRALGQAGISGLEKANMYNQALSVGKNFGAGLAAGIQSTTSQIAAQAAATVRTAINAANAEQNAHSPAKETIKVGHNFGEGTEIGIRDMIPDVTEASMDMMNAALSVPDNRWAIDAINDAVYSRSTATGKMYYNEADPHNVKNSGKITDEMKQWAKEVGTVFAKEVEGMGLNLNGREFGRVVRNLS